MSDVPTFVVDKSNTFDVLLTSINGKINLSPRDVHLDEKHVESLMCDSPDTYEPIQVATLDNGASYVLVDGYHRVEAATRMKATSLRAVLVRYELTEADKASPNKPPYALLLAAYDANVKHGRPLSVQERKDYAYIMYLLNPGLSWVQLAKIVKVSDKTVKAYVKSQEKEAANDAENEDEGTEEEKVYERAQVDYTKKLVNALSGFYSNERALFGQLSGTRSENKRVKALVGAVKKSEEVATLFDSLARSFAQAAGVIREKLNEQDK